MKRETMLNTLRETRGIWDFIVIGGGATGLGTAVEAASRGYRTLLLEQHDFAKGTSSRSTKLIHGGVRYLQQGNISLVLEALHERGLLISNAPHLVRHQSFIVPNYDWWEGPFYGIGLKVYDLLAGELGLGPSKLLSKEATLERIPTLEPEGLRGGVIYYDGQFDDARLAINLAQTLVEQGGTPLNYVKVNALLKNKGTVTGVLAQEMETGDEFEIQARVVVNATGVFADTVLRMDEPLAENIISPSQGVHLIVDKAFLPGDSAIMVPHTDDGRVLFAVPWHNKVLVGTTDTPVTVPALEPRALSEEVEFILQHAAKYLTHDPRPEDVLSVFAGLRPLVKAADSKNTAALSRDHSLMVSVSGLVTIAGGKWTTYRKMGEDTVNQAAMVACLDQRKSVTATMHIHGWMEQEEEHDRLSSYGADASSLRNLMKSEPGLGTRMHERLPYTPAEILWAVRSEMACTVEDVLARRTRALLLDARTSIEMAPETAALMAAELNKSKTWQEQQVAQYAALAKGYLLV
ncbi:MAG: glycerol-3-phosphate dehydrogenase/oxidase [bacterium]